MMVEPSYPNLVELTVIPRMYQSAVDGKFIMERRAYGIRYNGVNYYFHIMDLLGEKNEIKAFLDKLPREECLTE